MADEILGGLSKTFDAMYSKVGRPSIPPERLLNSQLLTALGPPRHSLLSAFIRSMDAARS